MVIYNGKQKTEGLDKIAVILHPCLGNRIRCNYYKDSKNRVQIIKKKNKYNTFSYLFIHAECIDLDKNILKTIAHILYLLICQGIIYISSSNNSNFGKLPYKNSIYRNLYDKIQIEQEYEITEDFIYNNIDHFIIGISEIEFFFDMRPEWITVSDDVPSFFYQGRFSYEELQEFKNTNKGKRAIIKYESTIYSKDARILIKDATLIYYNREEKLLSVNQAKHSDIMNYPYKHRIEFRLKRTNSKYLAIENLNGTYDEIMQKFIPLLSILYYNYFHDVIFVNSCDSHYFNIIYTKAKEGKKRYMESDLLKYEVDGSIRFTLNHIYSSYEYLIKLLNKDDTIIKHKEVNTKIINTNMQNYKTIDKGFNSYYL